MATKLRLQRHGKKGYAFFHIVAADTRAKRDGRFIEKVGTYNPNTNPATIDLDFDRALYWVQVGAEMTDTTRAILSYKGVLYKNHLLNGVKKGALTEADVEKKFEAWLSEKEAKITKKADAHIAAREKAVADKIAAEKAVNEAKAKELEEAEAAARAEEEAAKAAEEAAKAEAEAAEAAEAAEETPAEDAPAEEAPAEETKADEEE